MPINDPGTREGAASLLVALSLPDAFAKEVTTYLHVIGESSYAKFVVPRSYRVVLARVALPDQDVLKRVEGLLRMVCSLHRPVTVSCDRLERGRRDGDGRIRLNVVPTEELVKLSEDIRGTLAKAGLGRDVHPFVPHVTIARNAFAPGGSLPSIELPHPVEVGRVELLERQGAREVASYRHISSIELAAR